jgi:ABC-type branched-subunit amino acid transport system ATPase component
MSSEPVLELDASELRFGDVRALDGIDLTVGAGERLAVIGPTGAGKGPPRCARR